MDRRHLPWGLVLAGLVLPGCVMASPCSPLTMSAAALALSCEGCHGRGGRSVDPIPSLAGQSVEDLQFALRSFQQALPSDQLMPRLLKNVAPATLRELACYFSQMVP